MHAAVGSVLTIAVAVAAGAGLVGGPVSPAGAADGYRWASPVDGDTIKLLNGRSVRLLGYDSPEVDQCGYESAYAKMASLLRRPVKVVKRNGKDDYGRTLAYVRTRNGRDVGTVMLQRGLGVARYDALDGYRWHPKQKLYRSLDSTNGEICAEPEPDVVPSPEPTVIVPFVPPVDVSYENCDAVRAAGAAPIYRGQPGYAPHLDRDGDGVGCE